MIDHRPFPSSHVHTYILSHPAVSQCAFLCIITRAYIHSFSASHPRLSTRLCTPGCLRAHAHWHRWQVTRLYLYLLPSRSNPAARVDGWLAAFMRPRARNWKASSLTKGSGIGGSGCAAVTDKRKTVSEGNPIGGRRRRDVPASLVRPRSAGRGDAGLVGSSHPWQRLPEGNQGSCDARNPAWRRPGNP